MILDHPCPTCGSKPGEPCRTLHKPGVGTVPTTPHLARRTPPPAPPGDHTVKIINASGETVYDVDDDELAERFLSIHVNSAQSIPSGVGEALLKLVGCCWGSHNDGPAGCTCWEPIYDLEQQPPDPSIDVDVHVARASMCADCAYRPDSPERSGDQRYALAGAIDTIVGVTPFWCHDGMRKPIGWRHPAGITIMANSDAYDPPKRLVGGHSIPYKADGTPGTICAGWATRTRISRADGDESAIAPRDGDTPFATDRAKHQENCLALLPDFDSRDCSCQP